VSSPGHVCLLCGASTEGLLDGCIGLLCLDCLPSGTVGYQETITARIRAALIFREVPAETDIGPFGTEELPRCVAIPPDADEFYIDYRPGEQVEARALVTVRIRAKLASTVRRDAIEVVVTFNEWRRDRKRYEDRLQVFRRAENLYLELYARRGTDDIVWSSGWQPLDQHLHGAPRVSGPTPSEISLPILRRTAAE